MRTQAIAALVAAGSAVSFAAEPSEPIHELEPIVVYASRIGDTSETIAATVDVLDEHDIAASGASDLPELLVRRSSAAIRTLNSNPTQTQISMGGFGENSFGRVQVFLDGESLNSVDMEPPDLSRVPLGCVRRLEVVHGPSPVLYGDGAIGGVVNVTTDFGSPSARDGKGEGNGESGREPRSRVTAKVGSERTVALEFATEGGDDESGVDYSASYGYARSDVYRDRSGYDRHAASAAVRKTWRGGSSFTLRAHYGNGLYEMPGSLTKAQWKAHPKSSQTQHDLCRHWNWGAASEAVIAFDDERRLVVNSAFSAKHRRTSWGDYHYCNEYDQLSGNVSPRYVDERDQFGHEAKFTVGADVNCDRYRVLDRSGYNAPKSRFDRIRAAVFAHEEFFLADGLSVVGGVRGEGIANRWSGCRGLAESNSRDGMVDAELALVWRPLSGLKTYVKGTRFHRSAFCDELNGTRDGRFLDPETGWSLNGGGTWRIGREAEFGLDLYAMRMEDEIFFNPHAIEMAGYWGGWNCNSPSATRRFGLDSSFSWRREKVAEATLRYGCVHADFMHGQYGGREIPLVPAHRVRAEAGVWPCRDVELVLGANYLSRQRLSGDYDNDHGWLSDRFTVDFTVFYEPSWAKGWKASLRVDNLFDEKTCGFAGWSDYAGAYYYPGAGRTFLLSVTRVF